MTTLRVSLAAIAALALSPACATDDAVTAGGPDTPGLDDDFARASQASGVPADLLKAVAYVETQWQMVDGQAEHEGRPAGGGVFGLWGENLTQGAAAIGRDEATVRSDEQASIAAGAARLAQLAGQHGVGAGDDLAAWTPVLAEFAQVPGDAASAAYAADVLRVLAAGARAVGEDGTVIAEIAPHAEVSVPRTLSTYSADYAPAIWRPSPNYNSRNGYAVSLVVIHSCEGNYAGCWGWLVNSAAQASAHYVVREDGGEISQLVTEANRAWHVAAAYDCANAGGAQCNLTGVSTNNFSVGIEHAGFASQASWSAGIIDASAKLTCDITKGHGVVRDRNHIVSHGQLQPSNRTDPGPNWPWSQYIDLVRANCGDTGGTTIIVDSNQANNDAAVASVEVTADWVSSSSTPGYYGSGYWYANTAASSSPATFWFYAAAAGTKTIDGWWTTGTNRSTTATFIAYNASGTEVGRRSVNQQTSGSQWVALGTWTFSAGWNKVQLSRWAAEGSVVIADAIRVR